MSDAASDAWAGRLARPVVRTEPAGGGGRPPHASYMGPQRRAGTGRMYVGELWGAEGAPRGGARHMRLLHYHLDAHVVGV